MTDPNGNRARSLSTRSGSSPRPPSWARPPSSSRGLADRLHRTWTNRRSPRSSPTRSPTRPPSCGNATTRARLRLRRLPAHSDAGAARAAGRLHAGPRNPRLRPGPRAGDHAIPALLRLHRRLRPRDPAQGPGRAGRRSDGGRHSVAALGRVRLDDLQQQGQARPHVRAVLLGDPAVRVREEGRRQHGPVLRSADRTVATLHPDNTWEKIVFDPWRQETWDGNDTVLIADPRTDADVGDYFARLLGTAQGRSRPGTSSASAGPSATTPLQPSARRRRPSPMQGHPRSPTSMRSGVSA